MVRVFDMAGSEAVPQSLTNMSFGSPSSSDDDHSFIVLDRMTAEDREMIENELASSMRGVHLDNAVPMNSNHFAATPISMLNGVGAMPPSTVLNGEGTLPPCTAAQGEEGARVPTGFLNGEITVSSLSGSCSLPSDVQQRMESLVEDNTMLQDTVNQTNYALKQMMMTLTQWRDDAGKLREDHKMKFQATRDRVLKLMKEKEDMRIVMNEQRHKIEELENKLQLPSLFETVVPSVNEIELNSVIADLQSKLSIVDTAYKAELEKSGACMIEITALKSEMASMKGQLDHYVALQREMEKYKADLLDFDLLREENIRLKNDVQNLSSVERHSQDYQVAQAKGFTQRVDELTAKLMSTEELLQKAQVEIDQLKSQQSPGGTEEALSVSSSTIERLRLRIDEMTALIVESEGKYERKNQENLALQEENSNLKIQNEAVGILQAQVDVYQADFNAERECRERLAAEKEQLAEDLRRLHQVNLRLHERVDNREYPDVSLNQGGNEDGDRAEQPAGEPPQASYLCPICERMSFRTLHAIDEHIDQCPGRNGSL